MTTNYFLVATLIGLAIYAYWEISVLKNEIEHLKAKRKALEKDLQFERAELERAKKAFVQKDRVVKYFERFRNEIPAIEQAFNDLIGGAE